MLMAKARAWNTGLQQGGVDSRQVQTVRWYEVLGPE